MVVAINKTHFFSAKVYTSQSKTWMFPIQEVWNPTCAAGRAHIGVSAQVCGCRQRGIVKNQGFFSSYPVSIAQETGGNIPCDPFRLGCFYFFLHMLYWVFLPSHCVWKCSKETCFNMTIICSMGLRYSTCNSIFGSELTLNFCLWLFTASCNA